MVCVLEDDTGSEGGGGDLEHALLQDEVVAPGADELGHESRAGGTIVKETLHT